MGVKLSEWRLKLTDGVSKKIEKIKQIADKSSSHMERLNGKLKGLAVNIKDAAMEIPGLSTAFELLSNPVAIVGALGVAFGAFVTQLHAETENLAMQQSRLATVFGESGAELQGLTADTVAASKVFKISEEDLIRSAKALEANFDELRGNGKGALDLVVRGLQETKGLLDLNEIKEYATQMRSVGLTAENTIAIATQQINQGIYSDKGFDAIKEAGLRLREMTPAAEQALAGIGLSSTAILKALDDGSMTTFDAIQMVSKAMAQANTQAQSTAIADLFGGAGEDAGLQFLLSLQGINLELQNMSANQDPIIQAQNQRLEMERQIAMQQLEIAPVLNEMYLNMELIMLRIKSAFIGAFGWLIENGDIILNMIIGFVSSYTLFNAQLIISKGLILGVQAATNLATAATWLWNIAMNANPIGIIITLVGALIGIMITLFQKSENFRGMLYGMWEAMKEVFSAIKNIFMEVFGGISDVIMGIFSGDWDKVKSGFKSLGKGIISANPVGIYLTHGEKIGGAFAKGFDDGVAEVRANNADNLMGVPTVPDMANMPAGFDGITGQGRTASGAMLPGQKSDTKISPTSAGITAVNGGGKTVRNVTVNINKLVEQIVVKAEKVQDSTSEIKRLVEEALIKAIQGGEIAISNE